jgi:hypothetical protein
MEERACLYRPVSVPRVQLEAAVEPGADLHVWRLDIGLPYHFAQRLGEKSVPEAPGIDGSGS